MPAFELLSAILSANFQRVRHPTYGFRNRTGYADMDHTSDRLPSSDDLDRKNEYPKSGAEAMKNWGAQNALRQNMTRWDVATGNY